MRALLPLALERQVALLTISGTANLADTGNPWFFRFFPSDEVVKVAQVSMFELTKLVNSHLK